MTSIEEQFPIFSAEDSIRQKDWAAGTSRQCESTELIIPVGGKPEWRTVSYAPAWLKMFDEVLVNALDQMVKMSGEDPADRVTRITIGFTDGRFRVENNGRGIPCEYHKVGGCWLPELFMGRLFQSSNHVKRAGTVDEIVGGVNGIGSKIPQLLSTEFTLETYDLARKRWYYQQWRNKMTLREDPKIFRTKVTPANASLQDIPGVLAARAYPHTTVAFAPDYSHFGYTEAAPPPWQTLTDIIHTRVVLAACFVKFISPATTIVFNGVEVGTTLDTLARELFNTNCVFTAVVKPKISKDGTTAYKYPWLVTIAASSAPKKSKGSISVINGIVVRSGKHIGVIQDQIMEKIREQIMKTFNDNKITFSPAMIKKYINVMICAQIPSPNWEGQRKDTFVIDDPKKLAGYALKPEFIRAVCEGIQPLVIEQIFGSEMRKMAETVNKSDITWDKYWPAFKAGGRESSRCTLFVLEGDSAANSVTSALKNTIGMEYYGVISTQGVIINTRKESTIFPGIDGRYIKQSTKLKDNKFIQAWYGLTGMNPYAAYDPASTTYAREISRLKYGKVVLFTDQDYDGVGNIDPLMLNFARLMFPRLVEQGYFHVFESPKTRLYHCRKIYEFYNDEDLAAFIARNNLKNPNVKYYKGIGSHDRDEMQRMMKATNRSITKYIVDAETDHILESYYGVDTTPRKVELRQPLRLTSADVKKARSNNNGIPISVHIQWDAGQFQRDNIDRKLLSAIDGFNQSSRMIYNTARVEVRGKIRKVSELSGAVAGGENYAHGEDSLQTNISRKAFIAIGGRQLPMFYPHGQFGTRGSGPEGAANPRYIKIELIETYLLLYPEADYPLLEFNFEEGRRYEPKYFVPIIPMAITDNLCQPAHGWKIEIFSRDVFKIIEAVRLLIHTGNENLALPALPLATQGHTGELRNWAGKQYSCGRYEFKGSTKLIVKELPYTVWTNNYIKFLEERQSKDNRIIAPGKIKDKSTDTAIHIVVPLVPGARQLLEEYGINAFDGVEEYFGLRLSLQPHINLVGDSKQVIEFATYEKVINYWFPFRRDLYNKRIDRELEILAIKVIYYENVIRYIENSIENNMPRKSRVEQVKYLRENDYVAINKTLLFSPGFTPTDQLRESIIANGNYKYLTSLSDDDKSSEAYDDFKEKLAATHAQLTALESAAAQGKFRGARVWLNELNALEANIRLGLQTNWEFGNHNKYTYAE